MTNLVKRLSSVLIATIIAGVCLTGCDKEELLQTSGMVTYYGDFSAGGCGWVIEVGDGAYQAQNLPDAFLIDSLPIDLTYKILQEAPDCRNRNDVFGIIYIHKVEIIN